MANRVSASIKLGGVLPRGRLAELLDVIAVEGLSTDWDGSPFSGVQIQADSPIELFAHEVAGGSFDELESFCLSHALPFVRWCDGYPANGARSASSSMAAASPDPTRSTKAIRSLSRAQRSARSVRSLPLRRISHWRTWKFHPSCSPPRTYPGPDGTVRYGRNRENHSSSARTVPIGRNRRSGYDASGANP